MIFKNRQRNYPIHGVHDDVPGVSYIGLIQGHGCRVRVLMIGSTSGQLSTRIHNDAREWYLWTTVRATTKRRLSHSLYNLLAQNSKTSSCTPSFLKKSRTFGVSHGRRRKSILLKQGSALGQDGSGKRKHPGKHYF